MHIIKSEVILAFCVFITTTTLTFAQTGFNISKNAVVKFSQSSIVTIKNDLSIETGATLTQGTDAIINLTGNFSNNGTYSPSNATVLLNGINDQNIGGITNTNFSILSVDKLSGTVFLNIPISIDGSLRLISNSIFDIKSNDLTLGTTAKVYSDNGTNELFDSFTETKCVVNSGSSTDPLAGAFLIKKIDSSITLPSEFIFPISTPDVFSSLKIRILANGVVLSGTPYIKVKPYHWNILE